MLWVGDAVAPTGFARVTHNVLAHLVGKWDIHVLGLNYLGDPNRYSALYPIWPAVLGGDVFGIGRLAPLVKQLRPDVVVINNDPWIVAGMLKEIPGHVPVVAYMPVDARNQQSARDLSYSLAAAVCYTDFGARELVAGGYQGRTEVVPHGIDPAVYYPRGRAEARAQLLRFTPPRDLDRLFIVGNVNRNQPRKRLDLTLEYWTAWWHAAGQPAHAHLYVHAAVKGDGGYDLQQLASYYGIERQFIPTSTRLTSTDGVREADMAAIYSLFDVQLSTTQGEGWGLTTHEGMACGVAQIVPDYAALGEWPRGAADLVPISGYAATPEDVNTLGGVPDKAATVDALMAHYLHPEHTAKMAAAALARATEPRFRWPDIAARFDALCREVVGATAVRPSGLGEP